MPADNKTDRASAIRTLGMLSSVGIAFVLSAGAFYAIYRRFGLWEAPALNTGSSGE